MGSKRRLESKRLCVVYCREWRRCRGEANEGQSGMTPTQFKTERERLGFTQETVADLADLSIETIRDFEEGRSINASLVDAIRVTMESVGASFECKPK